MDITPKISLLYKNKNLWKRLFYPLVDSKGCIKVYLLVSIKNDECIAHRGYFIYRLFSLLNEISDNILERYTHQCD